MTVQTAIVGYGYAGRAIHARLIRRVPELALTAVVTRDAERRRQAETDLGVRTHASLEALLGAGPRPELVVLATPHDTHPALAIAAMEAGCHVVVEKVMCLRSDDADAMIAAAQKAGVVLSIFHNRRWDWDFASVRELVASGRMGRVFRCESAVLNRRSPRGWRRDAATMGGLLFDWGAHLIDQALVLAGGATPLRVSCHVLHLGVRETDIGDHARLELEFPGPLLYGIEVGGWCVGDRRSWAVHGTEGSLFREGLDPQEAPARGGYIADPPADAQQVTRCLFPTERGVREEQVPTRRPDWVSYYRALAAALQGRGPVPTPGEEGRAVVRVLERAMRAARGEDAAS